MATLTATAPQLSPFLPNQQNGCPSHKLETSIDRLPNDVMIQAEYQTSSHCKPAFVAQPHLPHSNLSAVPLQWEPVVVHAFPHN